MIIYFKKTENSGNMYVAIPKRMWHNRHIRKNFFGGYIMTYEELVAFVGKNVKKTEAKKSKIT